MAKEQSFTASRRSVLRGSALAGGLMLGSGLGSASPSLTRADASAAGDAANPRASLTLVDYFLNIDGIAGESQDATHQGWIDIDSYGFEAANATKPTGAKKGKSSLSPIHFTRLVDATSPKLMTHCVNGKHIAKATLSMRASNAKVDFLTINFTDIVISKYAQSAADSETPTEQLSLNFTKIEIKYTTQSAG
jgi:type VI secretion system secreted protein Hcp